MDRMLKQIDLHSIQSILSVTVPDSLGIPVVVLVDMVTHAALEELRWHSKARNGLKAGQVHKT
jgi:hypothetical protein